MITISVRDGKTVAEQTTKAPTVYLDQWVWSRLSKDDWLRERFLAEANAAQGTLMLSLVSFLELAQQRDEKQLRKIKAILDTVDFGFVEINALKVIERERRFASSEPGVFVGGHPAVDHELLWFVASECSSGGIVRLSLVFEHLLEEAPARYARMALELANALTPRIEEARASEDVLARAKAQNKKRVLTRSAPPYTADILSMAVNHIVANETLRMNANEWIDVFHMIVPVAYSDIVLLDKRWIHFIQSVVPLEPPNIAKVYRPSDLPAFLSDLGRWHASVVRQA